MFVDAAPTSIVVICCCCRRGCLWRDGGFAADCLTACLRPCVLPVQPRRSFQAEPEPVRTNEIPGETLAERLAREEARRARAEADAAKAELEALKAQLARAKMNAGSGNTGSSSNVERSGPLIVVCLFFVQIFLVRVRRFCFFAFSFAAWMDFKCCLLVFWCWCWRRCVVGNVVALGKNVVTLFATGAGLAGMFKHALFRPSCVILVSAFVCRLCRWVGSWNSHVSIDLTTTRSSTDLCCVVFRICFGAAATPMRVVRHHHGSTKDLLLPCRRGQ